MFFTLQRERRTRYGPAHLCPSLSYFATMEPLVPLLEPAVAQQWNRRRWGAIMAAGFVLVKERLKVVFIIHCCAVVSRDFLSARWPQANQRAVTALIQEWPVTQQ